LGNFTAHLGRVGARLGAAVEAYNSAVGSLERQVMPQARRFPELGVTPDAPLAELEQIDHLARTVSVPEGAASPEDAGAPLREGVGAPLPKAAIAALPEGVGAPVPNAANAALPESNDAPLPKAANAALPESNGAPLPNAANTALPERPGARNARNG
jgi:hypothetical protein